MKTTLATRLRQLRLERNMTMKEVASAMQISRTTYRDWEYGRKMPAEMLSRLSDVFQVSLNELVGTDNNPTPQNLSQAITWIEEGLKLLKRSH